MHTIDFEQRGTRKDPLDIRHAVVGFSSGLVLSDSYRVDNLALSEALVRRCVHGAG